MLVPNSNTQQHGLDFQLSSAFLTPIISNTTSVRKVLDNNQRSPLRPLHKRVVSWFVSYMDRPNTTVPNPLYTHRALVYQHHKNGPKHHCGSLDFPPIRDHFLANPAVRQAEGVAPVAGSDGCHHRSEQTKGALQLGRCEILIPHGCRRCVATTALSRRG